MRHVLDMYFADDTIARKVNGSDASSFAKICGCCPSQGKNPIQIVFSITPFANYHSFIHVVWGVIWLLQAIIFFAAGIIVGLVAFKVGIVHHVTLSLLRR